MIHLMYTFMTGLGLYGGSRGKKWLKDRIRIYKQFVVPSLIAQTNQNFIVWVSFRPEDKGNKDIYELQDYLIRIFSSDRVVFTYSGVCIYDDKYPDEVAKDRLMMALHGSMHELVNYVTEDTVLMTVQPSDDCYHSGMVDEMQTLFKNTDYQAIGYQHGYIMNYQTLEGKEYNPKTNPPFVTVRFDKHTFMDPFRHGQYTSLKHDVGKYKKGTPVPSHEYYGDCFKYLVLPKRGFLVGTHGQNISTHFNNPYAGDSVTIPNIFGLELVKPIKIRYSIRKHILTKLPYRVQRKLRYIFGEKCYQTIYKFIHG